MRKTHEFRIIQEILSDERLSKLDNRMEAWEAVKRAGADVPWELFKRIRMKILIERN